MHGRPRKSTTPVDENASALRAAQLRSLQSQFLHNHHNQIYTKEALEINKKLLEANPEYMTAWNYRKLAFQHNLSAEEPDSALLDSLIEEELRVVESALKKNFKSYGAWHHRKWMVSKWNSSTERELRLLNLFQKQDTRNFHAWNYRRFIATLKNIPDEEELQFTTDMINDNFSNYSAWHNRSVLLSHLHKEEVKGYFPKENFLIEEYEFVRNAVFTDPDDQSGWFYHLWLLDQTVNVETPVLLSSWPPHNSDIYIQIDLDILSPVHSQARNVTFPVVLYFNESVEGVNSHTVTVQSDCDIDDDFTWTALSVNKSGCAQAWVTNMKILNKELQSSKDYEVRVSIGNAQGITSFGGVPYRHSSDIAFTVHVHHDLEHAKGENSEKISWRDENFCTYEMNSKEVNILKSSYQLTTKEEERDASSKWKPEAIANEISNYRELLSWADCKIGKLTLARLLMAYDSMNSNNNHSEEVLQLYSKLMKLDPPHFQYYKDEYSLVLLKQITSSMESLLGYCHQYRESSCWRISDFICLRLNNLSLSRIGSIEQLLWLQVLDLSDNQLKSIEGLEAMQRLSCLNLSNNKLGSFTALDPLRFVKSLKVLDISYNEIGAHAVDTRRYLCSSLMSHTAPSDWNFEEFTIGDGNFTTNYWEAFSVFRGLRLTQLDIIGNSAVNENFKSFLLKVLPGLKWLDGEVLL